MAETIDCTQCGSTNSVDARFCSTCGASLSPPITGPTTRLAGTVCPNCGTDNPQTAQFCALCGQHLAAEPVPRPQQYSPTHAAQRRGVEGMYCPICRDVTLVIADRQGIEVDYCPNCRGVWLDRGELDKIIERVALHQGDAARYPAQPREHGTREYREPRDHDDAYGDYRRKKKPRGLLGELFDFD